MNAKCKGSCFSSQEENRGQYFLVVGFHTQCKRSQHSRGSPIPWLSQITSVGTLVLPLFRCNLNNLPSPVFPNDNDSGLYMPLFLGLTGALTHLLAMRSIFHYGWNTSHGPDLELRLKEPSPSRWQPECLSDPVGKLRQSLGFPVE